MRVRMSKIVGVVVLAGATSDRRFIDMMIRHHEGAVQMAEQVVPDGEDPRVSELAQTITSAQTDEIERMRSVLADMP